MQKTAQKRSLLSKLREMTNIGGIAAEKFFHPEFQELMDRLRNETDDPIRAIVSGQKIGDADPPTDGIGIKDLLKSARSNLNRREYMKTIADMSRFHKKMEDVVKILDGFKYNIDAIHEKFLFQDLDDESKKHLHELKGRLAHSSHELVKEAGLLDLLTNLATERGRALAAWEKRYPKQVSKLKKDTENLLKKSESLSTTTLTALKEMASARATRRVENYILSGEKIAKAYRNYDAEFRKYYIDNIKGFLEKQELVAPIKPVENPQDIGNQRIRIETPPPVVQEDPSMSAPIPLVKKEPITEKENDPPTVEEDIATAPTVRSPAPAPSPAPVTRTVTPVENLYQQIRHPGAVPGLKQKSPPADLVGEVPTLRSPGILPKPAHQKFLTSLEVMGTEHPVMLISHIKKYAQDIHDSDPDTANQLLQLIERIKE